MHPLSLTALRPTLATALAEEAPPEHATSGCGACRFRARCADRRAGRLAAERARTGLGRPGAVVSRAHRHGRAVAVALPAGWRVGVDVEPDGAVAPGRARYFARTGELVLAGDATVLWLLKEAAWKLLRLGCDVPFHALELRTWRGDEVTLAVAGGELTARAQLHAPWSGWRALALWTRASTVDGIA